MGERPKALTAREFQLLVAEALGLKIDGLIGVEIETGPSGEAQVVAKYCFPADVAMRLLPEKRLISDEQMWHAIDGALKHVFGANASAPASAAPAPEAASPESGRPASQEGLR